MNNNLSMCFFLNILALYQVHLKVFRKFRFTKEHHPFDPFKKVDMSNDFDPSIMEFPKLVVFDLGK